MSRLRDHYYQPAAATPASTNISTPQFSWQAEESLAPAR
jgi:hypothetical protein